MQPRRPPIDEGAVSPVVGTILLVGIVVAAMTILATMVVGGGPFERPPDADLVYNETDDGGDVNVTVAFTSVEGLTMENTDVRVDGATCDDVLDGSGDVDVGHAVTVDTKCDGSGDELEEGDSVQIVVSRGSQSTMIDSYDVRGP